MSESARTAWRVGIGRGAYLYALPDGALVATGCSLWHVDRDGAVRWRCDNLGIDGVPISKVVPAERSHPPRCGKGEGCPSRRARRPSCWPVAPALVMTGDAGAHVANDLPGWTARELVDELVARPARVVGFDFPFCVPHALLRDPKFAADVGYDDGAFLGWRSFNAWIARRLPLTDPLDFTPFAPWRDRAERTRLWILAITTSAPA